MLKGVVVQGPVWESHEAILQPLIPPPRECTERLVTCQGGKVGKGFEPRDQRYAKGGKVTPGPAPFFSQDSCFYFKSSPVDMFID